MQINTYLPILGATQNKLFFMQPESSLSPHNYINPHSPRFLGTTTH